MNGRFQINDRPVEIDFPSDATLLETLRQNGFTDVKFGCGDGECGACLVILNGELVNSCQVFTATAIGSTIVTSAGLGSRLDPHAIHRAFAETGAVQCGYCTPGMVMATQALLTSNPNPTRAEIGEALVGNLCRCTGYAKIIEAVERAAELLRDDNR